MKIFKILTVMFLAFSFLIACQGQQEKSKHLKPMLFTEFYQGDLLKVDKLVIRSGSTGESRTITDLARIGQWLDFIKDIRFVPDPNQEGRSGWRYSVSLFEGEKEVFKFNPNQINDVYYIVDEKVINSIEELYNTVPTPKGGGK